jgi:hypothetical protein
MQGGQNRGSDSENYQLNQDQEQGIGIFDVSHRAGLSD